MLTTPSRLVLIDTSLQLAHACDEIIGPPCLLDQRVDPHYHLLLYAVRIGTIPVRSMRYIDLWIRVLQGCGLISMLEAGIASATVRVRGIALPEYLTEQDKTSWRYYNPSGHDPLWEDYSIPSLTEREARRCERNRYLLRRAFP